MTGETNRLLGDPEIAVEILKLRVAELEQAIRRLAEQDATLSVCEGNVTVTMDATLTEAERRAVGVAIQCVEAAMAQRHPEEEDARDLLHKTSCTLSRLFDRMTL
jgi:hypothetical protein